MCRSQGFSYGTGVGSAYAAVYPTHIGRMILNGNIQGGMDGTREVLTADWMEPVACSRGPS